MPLELSFEAPSTLLMHASGDITFAEVAVMLNELLDDVHLPGSWMLVNANEVETVPSTAELRMIARDLGPLRERGLGPMAIVAGSTFVYGIARMFAVFAENAGTKVVPFRVMKDAEGWLAEQMANSVAA